MDKSMIALYWEALNDGCLDEKPEYKATFENHLLTWEKWIDAANRLRRFNTLQVLLNLPSYRRVERDFNKLQLELDESMKAITVTS